MTDAEHRIEIIGRLNAALLAELQLLPISVRDEVCAKIVASALSLWEFRPEQPLKLNFNGKIERYYCAGCGKIMDERNGKVVRVTNRQHAKQTDSLPDAGAPVIRLCDSAETGTSTVSSAGS